MAERFAFNNGANLQKGIHECFLTEATSLSDDWSKDQSVLK